MLMFVGSLARRNSLRRADATLILVCIPVLAKAIFSMAAAKSRANSLTGGRIYRQWTDKSNSSDVASADCGETYQ